MGYVVPTETLEEIRQTVASLNGKKAHGYPDGRTKGFDDWEWCRSTVFGSGVARTMVTDMMASGAAMCLLLDWPDLVQRYEFTEKQLRAGVQRLIANGNGRVVHPATHPDFRYEHEHFGWNADLLLLLSPSRLVREAWEREVARDKAARRAEKVALRGGQVNRVTIPDVVKAKVYARDDFTCQRCGATENLTLDHIEPWSRGGPDTAENLRVLCRPCNSRKGDRA